MEPVEPIDLVMLLRAYACGFFPMADSRDAPTVHWVEPKQRGILPLDRFHLSRSLARTLRRESFALTANADFPAVLRCCAEATPDRPGTWINRQIEQAYIGLHRTGHAHSLECWHEGRLVGGLYGVVLGGAFFGESMFSRMTDASKVALAHLVARLRIGGFRLLDCQFITPHLASLGAIEIERDDYVALLDAALGGGTASSGDGAAVSSPDFFALDRVEAARAPSSVTVPGAVSGNFIAQALVQTS